MSLIENKKPLEGYVSEDFINLAATMSYNGIPLGSKSGKPDLDLILYALGFHYNYEKDKAEYIMITEDVTYNRVRDSTGVYIRDINNPTLVKYSKVFSGEIRKNYPFAAIYENDQVLTPSFKGNSTHKIDEIGESEHYNSSWVGGEGSRLGVEDEQIRLDIMRVLSNN